MFGLIRLYYNSVHVPIMADKISVFQKDVTRCLDKRKKTAVFSSADEEVKFCITLIVNP